MAVIPPGCKCRMDFFRKMIFSGYGNFAFAVFCGIFRRAGVAYFLFFEYNEKQDSTMFHNVKVGSVGRKNAKEFYFD